MRRFARPRYRIDRPTSRSLRRGSSVGIDVHGPLDRAKDVSSRWRRLLGVYQVECVRFYRHADHVPLLGDQRAPVVAGATACLGTSPMQARRTDQDPCSSGNPRRLPAPDGSGCLPPLRRRARGGLLLSRPASASRSRRPHVLPMTRDNVPLRALQASLSGEPGSDFERADAFFVLAGNRAWA